jgi:hypothetical protein
MLLGLIAFVWPMAIVGTGETRGVGRTVLLLLPAVALTAVLLWLAEFPLFAVGIMIVIPFYILIVNKTKGLPNLLAYVLPLVLVFGGLALWEARSKALLERGLPASARVLEVRDMNTNIGVDPLISLRLLVLATDGVPYEVETKLLVTRLAMAYYQPEVMVNVRIDPGNRKRVVVESIQSGRLP